MCVTHCVSRMQYWLLQRESLSPRMIDCFFFRSVFGVLPNFVFANPLLRLKTCSNVHIMAAFALNHMRYTTDTHKKRNARREHSSVTVELNAYPMYICLPQCPLPHTNCCRFARSKGDEIILMQLACKFDYCEMSLLLSSFLACSLLFLLFHAFGQVNFIDKRSACICV